MRRGRRKGGGRYDNDQLRHWYRGISNFSEVDGHRNLLMCWVAGDSARIADRLDDEEVRPCKLKVTPVYSLKFFLLLMLAIQLYRSLWPWRTFCVVFWVTPDCRRHLGSTATPGPATLTPSVPPHIPPWTHRMGTLTSWDPLCHVKLTQGCSLLEKQLTPSIGASYLEQGWADWGMKKTFIFQLFENVKSRIRLFMLLDLPWLVYLEHFPLISDTLSKFLNVFVSKG